MERRITNKGTKSRSCYVCLSETLRPYFAFLTFQTTVFFLFASLTLFYDPDHFYDPDLFLLPCPFATLTFWLYPYDTIFVKRCLFISNAINSDYLRIKVRIIITRRGKRIRIIRRGKRRRMRRMSRRNINVIHIFLGTAASKHRCHERMKRKRQKKKNKSKQRRTIKIL